jgi:hypothetical protein
MTRDFFREREREEEERSGEVVRDTTFGGRKKERIYNSGFEGSQGSARSSFC